MKIAIYKKDGTFATVLEGINNPKITGEELSFDNGSISGFDDKHILLDDETEIPADIKDARLLDQRAKYTSEKVDEITELKKQLQEEKEANEMNALALMELAEMVLGGMGGE